MFRHEIVFGLCALQETLSSKASRADGDLGLVHVVAHAFWVVELSEQNQDAVALVLLQHLVEGIVNREHENEHHGEDGEHLHDAFLFRNEIIGQCQDQEGA